MIMKHPIVVTPWAKTERRWIYGLELAIRQTRLRKERIARDTAQAKKFLAKLSSEFFETQT